jgi:transposase
MHTEEKRNQFIELRAAGLSFDKIAADIGVTKKTLIDWSREFADDIEDLKTMAREHLRERLIGTQEQFCGRIVAHFNRLDAEFGKREFKYSPTESVFRMMLSARETIVKELRSDPAPRQRTTKPAEPAQEGTRE